MVLRIAHVLDAAALDTIREALKDKGHFEDGRATAGWSARAVKDNSQTRPGARTALLAKTVEKALRENAVFAAAVRPKAFARIVFSRYETGQSYGLHVDDPLIAGLRTDVSFTLFLSDPRDYDGGALVLEEASGETEIKLNAGDAVVYPTSALHRVEEITKGVRLAAVGWVRSHIRLDSHREILFDLDLAAREVFDREGKTALFDRLAKAKSNLMRLWAED